MMSQEKVDGEIINTNYKTDTIVSATTDYIRLYQHSISELKNGKCAMYPSCSNYGLMVLDKYPLYKALPMIADRLVRCSHDTRFYDTTYEYGYRSVLDYPFEDKLSSKLIFRKSVEPKVDVLKFGVSDNMLIDALINKGLYASAMIEIEKMQMCNIPSQELCRKKLLCYRRLGKFEEGVFEFENELPSLFKRNPGIALQAAIMYNEIGNVPSALDAIKNIDECEDSLNSHKLLIYSAYLHIQKGSYERAKNLFLEAGKLSGDKNLCMHNLATLKSMINKKQKSPLYARLLSIIPGGGYLYTGHKRSAIASLVINSLLAYATYTSVKSSNYGVSGICGFMSLSFYIGNINGAGKSAERYNKKTHDSYLQKIYSDNKIFIY